jgi:hypothetical protein
MTLLVDQTGKKSLMLVEWPQSLWDAHRAGILTGKAEQEAIALNHPRRQSVDHPWNQAIKHFRAMTAADKFVHDPPVPTYRVHLEPWKSRDKWRTVQM